MKIVITILLLSVLTTPTAYNIRCPYAGNWVPRALAKCNTTTRYVCLWDDLAEQDAEKCIQTKAEQYGHKQVLNSGNLDRRRCSPDYFQPFQFNTFNKKRCVYEKSFCNEEGQVVADNGTLDRDRSCRCDYTRGYAFIKKNTGKCFCIPSEEDCSCYLKRCIGNKRLSPDYKCADEKILLRGDYGCSFITSRPEIVIGKHVITNHSLEYPTATKMETKVSRLIMLVGIILCTCIVCFACGQNRDQIFCVDCVEGSQTDKTKPFEGERVVFTFNGTKNDHQIYWYKDDVKLKFTERHKEDINGKEYKLEISDINIYDSGKYSVHMGDYTSEEIEITVQGKITIPLAIQNMSEREKGEYYKILEDGYENRYYVKIFLVGKEGTVKTSLMRRLLLEELSK